MIKLFIIGLIFILGLIFFCKNNNSLTENFVNSSNYECPNLLIKKNNKIFLYNSKEARVPGVNPIQFNNLEDYTEFIEWQRSQNIRCPVLFLEQSYDAQNNQIYDIKANPFLQPDVNIGPIFQSQNLAGTTSLDNAGTDDPPYNQNDYAAFDPYNQYIGLKTPLDKMFQDNSALCSANPMDPNWCGHEYTKEAVDRGDYKEDYVAKLTQTGISERGVRKGKGHMSN